MPRVAMTPDNKASNPFEYPKLFLDKGERARIVLIEPEPLMEFTHTLKAVQIDPNTGGPVTKQVQRRGETVDEIQYDFVGRHICIGSNTTLEDKGVDTKNCPVCEASTKTDAVAPPQRRFALHVIRYTTKPGSFETADPFSVNLIGWAFSDKVFNTLVDLAVEWGDLRQHDLLLGPCEVKQFQKFDISIAKDAAWLSTEANKKLTSETYKENQSDDLTVLIGRKLTREMILDDLAKVLSRHKQAFGREVVEDTPAEVAQGMDLDGLLGGENGAPEDTSEPPTSGGEEPTTEDEPEPTSDDEEPKEEVQGESLSLEDLLS